MSNFAEYDYINRYNSRFSPSTVHCSNTALVRYYQKYLLEQVMSRYEWTLPEKWSKSYFLYTLFMTGKLAVIRTNKFGVIPQFCTLGGFDVFYQPTTAIITNPALGPSIEAKIHFNTELIRIQPDYTGIMDIVNLYADLMALTVETTGTNLVNSKLAYLFAAEDKTQAESMKLLYDTIQEGNPAVFADKKLFTGDGKLKVAYFAQDLKANFITPDLLETLRKIETMFNTDVGFPNTDQEKKERLIVDEVNMNNQETMSKASLWLETMQETAAAVNKKFDTELSVRFREIKGGGAGEQTGNISTDRSL